MLVGWQGRFGVNPGFSISQTLFTFLLRYSSMQTYGLTAPEQVKNHIEDRNTAHRPISDRKVALILEEKEQILHNERKKVFREAGA